jgi:hypothetical protein
MAGCGASLNNSINNGAAWEAIGDIEKRAYKKSVWMVGDLMNRATLRADYPPHLPLSKLTTQDAQLDKRLNLRSEFALHPITRDEQATLSAMLQPPCSSLLLMPTH